MKFVIYFVTIGACIPPIIGYIQCMTKNQILDEIHAVVSFLMDEQERLMAEGKEKEFWEIEPVLDTLQRRHYQIRTSTP